MSTPTEFADKIDKARALFLRELRDGCLDCQQCPHKGFCDQHQHIPMQALCAPTECQEFQDFLRQMGLVKRKDGGK